MAKNIEKDAPVESPEDIKAAADLAAEAEAKAKAEAEAAAAADAAAATAADMEKEEHGHFCTVLGYPLHHPYQDVLIKQGVEQAVKVKVDFWVKLQLAAGFLHRCPDPEA